MLLANLIYGRLPERTNGAASKVVVASGSPWVQIPYLPPFKIIYDEIIHGLYRLCLITR